MSHTDDNNVTYFAGGVVVFIIIMSFTTKILKYVSNELAELFNAFGKMATNFISMAWQIAIVLGVLSLGVASIWAAWYFSRQYYLMIKHGTAIKEQIELRFKELKAEMDSDFSDLSFKARREIASMRDELDDALKITEVVPVSASTVAPVQLTSDQSDEDANNDTDENDFDSYDQIDEDQNTISQPQVTPRNIHNPY